MWENTVFPHQLGLQSTLFVYFFVIDFDGSLFL
jgi:hypothetical protein